MKRIIGILGRSRAGKDTVASFISAGVSHNHKPELMYIAKTLKNTLRELYDFSEDQLFGNTKDVCDPRYGYTPRELCSHWNQTIAQIHGPDFFVRRMFQHYDAKKQHQLVIIPDVRYHHDCSEIRKRDGLIVKIVRYPFPLQLAEEAHIDGMVGDVVLFNTGDLQYLHKQVRTRVLPRLVEAKVTRGT